MNALLLFVSPQELVLIVVIGMVLFFGGTKIPELMKGMGTGLKEFKKAVKEEDKEEDSSETN